MTALIGARVFDGERFLDDRAVIVEGTRIARITAHAERPRDGGEIESVDALGAIIAGVVALAAAETADSLAGVAPSNARTV